MTDRPRPATPRLALSRFAHRLVAAVLATALLVPATLPVAAADPDPSAPATVDTLASEEPTATATASPTASPTAAPTPSPTPVPTPSPTPVPTPTPTPTPRPTPTPTPRPTPTPTPTPYPRMTVRVTTPGASTAWIRKGWEIPVRWTESDAAHVARRVVVKQRGRVDREGVCTSVAWANEWTKSVTSPRLVALGFIPGYCYRFVVSVTDTLGRVTTTRSGPLRTLTSWGGTYNTYRSTAFVTQKTFTWCVAASTQMTLNIARGTSDRTYATQQRIMAYAQSHDRYAPGVAKGSDPQGWVATLNYHGGTRGYHVVESTTYWSAVRAAVSRLRRTGKPVGLVVGRGSHAWTLHGFSATADPGITSTFTVTHVYVSGPLYPIQQRNGYDMPPNTRLSYSTFSKFLTPYYDRLGPSPWDRSYVTIQP